jgi:lipoprotein-anchoring transpeptidase ErfK/SrfK
MRPQPPGLGESRVAATTRPRTARIAAALAALLVTLVSVLGGLGILPGDPATARPSDVPRGAAVPPVGEVRNTESPAARAAGAVPPVPAASGSGRRIVFDMSSQRVWLVDRRSGRDVVVRTYPVSGSLTDNLSAGTYSVYSRSANAWGIDDSGSMRYMVRFAHGDNAAIGFHDIPVLHGRPVQTRAQLGVPRSHGCIRQWRPDAQALWRFAPVGTRVVVVA